jgi:response regulator RpfG family c-di-GMP phosphodiesterase
MEPTAGQALPETDEPTVGQALLVEDDAETRALIARYLRRSGLGVLAVESGERALEEAADRYTTFDVVILDVHLPGMSGLDLARLIQARRPSQPIVLITGDADPGLAREALARGPVSYLLKPFEMSALQRAVLEAIAGAARQAPAKESGGAPSRNWLDLVERTYMGSTHVRRVGRVALAIAEALPGVGTARLDIGDLLVAAWSHELGRGAGVAEPAVSAGEGAKLLGELGASAKVAHAVRHLAERHDGTGGPSGLAGEDIPLISQIVAVADALEHCAVVSHTGLASPTEAVDRGLDLVTDQRGKVFRPDVVDAARRQQARLITICADSAGVDAPGRATAGV